MRNLAQRAQSTQTPTEKATALCLLFLMSSHATDAFRTQVEPAAMQTFGKM